jgi:hypothetical protein
MRDTAMRKWMQAWLVEPLSAAIAILLVVGKLQTGVGARCGGQLLPCL